MRLFAATFAFLLLTAATTQAQPPERGPGGPPPDGQSGRPRGGPGMGSPAGMRGGPGGQSTANPTAAVTRMFTLDANKDGKLSKDEVTDSRLFALAQRADANQDGDVTRQELMALFAKEAAATNAG